MTTTVTSVSSSTTSQTLLAADGARTSVVLENTDTNRAYVLVGGSGDASATNFTFSLVEGASADIDAPECYEAMKVIWAGDGSGGLQVTATVSDTGISGDNTNLGDLKALIASDLERALADTTHGSRTWNDEIGTAIGDAIQLYKSKAWWFLQEPVSTDQTSTTTTDNSYVSEPTGLIDLYSLRITISGQKEALRRVSFSEMEDMHDGSTASGEPYAYCRFGARIRLYPTPSTTYTLTWSGLFEQATLSSDTVTNDWMTHGRLVIKAMAKLILLRDYIKSYEDVPAAESAVMQAEKALDREHIRRTSTRRLKARC